MNKCLVPCEMWWCQETGKCYEWERINRNGIHQVKAPKREKRARHAPARVVHGVVIKKKKLLVFTRDNFTCQYCGFQGNETNLTVDHRLAKSMGGDNTIDNLLCACRPCNQEKGNMSEEKFRKLISNKNYGNRNN